MSRTRSAAAALMLLGVLASCANQPAPTSLAPATLAPATSVAATSVAATSAPTTAGSTTSVSISPVPGTSLPTAVPVLSSNGLSPTLPLGGRRLSLTGTVEAGVERGCLLLTDAATGVRYNLTGMDPAVVKIGARVRVVGVIRKDLMSYCQQGAILQVLTASKY